MKITPKKAFGAFLVSLPMLAYVGVMVAAEGVLYAAGILGAVALMTSCILFGIKLLLED